MITPTSDQKESQSDNRSDRKSATLGEASSCMSRLFFLCAMAQLATLGEAKQLTRENYDDETRGRAVVLYFQEPPYLPSLRFNLPSGRANLPSGNPLEPAREGGARALVVG